MTLYRASSDRLERAQAILREEAAKAEEIGHLGDRRIALMLVRRLMEEERSRPGEGGQEPPR